MATLIGMDASGHTVTFEAGVSPVSEGNLQSIGPQVIRSAILNLTSAQILASFTTPILFPMLVPAANKTALILAASLLYTRGTTDYTGADDIGIWYATPAGALVGSAEIVDFGNWSALTTTNQLMVKTGSALIGGAGFTGAGLGFALATSTANPAAGNGTVQVKVIYAAT
jgi:hypothetical protein